MNLLIGTFILMLGWLQPTHIFPWVTWHSEALAFLAILVISWERVYLAATKRASGFISVPITIIPVIAIGIIVGLQWFFGLIDFGGDAIVYTAYLLLCVLGMTVSYTLEREKLSPMFALSAVLVVGTVCSAFIAFAQGFEVWESFGWIHRNQSARRPGANLAQPNHLATFLLMGLGSTIYLLESRRLGALLASVLSGVLLLALAATESRAGVLGFIVLTIWWFAKHKSMATQIKPWTVILCAAIYISVYWYWPVLMGVFFQLPGDATTANPVAFNRWIIWPQLINAVMLRPWLGWGMGQVSTAHNAIVDTYSVSEPYTYAHNIILDFALGMGVPLTIMAVICACVWGWRRLRTVKQLDSWYCIAIVISVAIHSLVEFPFSYSYFLLPVMLAIGALEGQQHCKPFFQLSIKRSIIGLIVITAAFGWSIVEYISIEEDYRVVRFEVLNVGKTPEKYQKPRVYMFTQLDALLNGFRIVAKPSMSAEEVEVSRVVALHYPMLSTQNRYAMILALNDNENEAIRQLRVIRAQHGAIAYAKVKMAWAALANEKYPQLADLQLP